VDRDWLTSNAQICPCSVTSAKFSSCDIKSKLITRHVRQKSSLQWNNRCKEPTCEQALQEALSDASIRNIYWIPVSQDSGHSKEKKAHSEHSPVHIIVCIWPLLLLEPLEKGFVNGRWLTYARAPFATSGNAPRNVHRTVSGLLCNALESKCQLFNPDTRSLPV
jgi:hypothetical protein